MLKTIGKKYKNVDQARVDFEREKIEMLNSIVFQDDWFHPKFFHYFDMCIKYQSPIMLQVITKDLVNNTTGERMDSTWSNFCKKTRRYQYPEVLTAVNILKGITPIMLGSESLNDFIVTFPEICSIINYMEKTLNEICNQICAPIKARINSELKIANQIPITQVIDFLQ